VAQQGRRVVEEHQVYPVAPDLVGERGNELPDDLLAQRGRRDRDVVDQDRNVDVAVGAFCAASPAAEQPGGADHRLGAQPAGEGIPQRAGRRVGHGGGGEVHAGTQCNRRDGAAAALPRCPRQPLAAPPGAGALMPSGELLGLVLLAASTWASDVGLIGLTGAVACRPLLADFMSKLDADVIGKGMGPGHGVDNQELIAVNEAIRSHPVEQVGKHLRGHMTAMKSIL